MMTLPAYLFADDEKPAAAGAPYTPKMTMARRLAYATTGTFAGLMTTFPNALTNVNLGAISGSLGLYTVEAAWLPALYFGMNASANLTLIKARAQFGIPRITNGLLIVYAIVAAIQLFLPGFPMAVLARIANGLVSGALATLSVYYFLVVLPLKMRPLALVLGVGLTQFGTPLARLVPVELLGVQHWQGMHWIELAVPLAVLGSILLAPLPPSERAQAFEPLDVLSIALLVSGIVLGCEVLGLGRLLWWSDTFWLGKMLTACVVLLAAGILIESRRARPLLQLSWLSNIAIVRFIAIALLLRLVLAEQTFGSVGLLSSAGLNNDQMHTLFLLVALAMVAGLTAATLTLSPARLPWQLLIAALCIAASGIMDSRTNSASRPVQLYLSQSLIGFGTTLFIGPALVAGFLQMLKKGGDHLITLVVVFSLTQNVGALAGSALIGTYQSIRAQVHSQDLAAQLISGDPATAMRIAGGAAAVASRVTDPTLRNAEGAALLSAALTREANTLAFNDVFALLAWLAGGTAGAIALFILFRRLPGDHA